MTAKEPDHRDTAALIRYAAETLAAWAKDKGYDLEIIQAPNKPLAAGNKTPIVTVHPARGTY